MYPRRAGATRARALFAILGVAALVLGALTTSELGAAPLAQAEPTSSPSPRVTATPRPTQTRDEQMNELEQRKLNREIRQLDAEIDRLRQQEAIESQAWRAPAAAVASFGPTLVGLGLVYLLARALSHWLPTRPPAPESGEDDELEDD